MHCTSSDADPFPKLRIELGAKGGNDPPCLFLGEATQQKRLVGERKTGRKIFREDDFRASFDKSRDILIIGCTDHAGNVHQLLVRKLQDSIDGGVAIKSDDDQPGLCEACGGQYPAMRGIAVDDRMALSLGFFETREIELNGDVRYLRRLKRGRNETADTSAPTQHNMSVERRACRANSILGCGHTGASRSPTRCSTSVALC